MAASCIVAAADNALSSPADDVCKYVCVLKCSPRLQRLLLFNLYLSFLHSSRFLPHFASDTPISWIFPLDWSESVWFLNIVEYWLLGRWREFIIYKRRWESSSTRAYHKQIYFHFSNPASSRVFLIYFTIWQVETCTF